MWNSFTTDTYRIANVYTLSVVSCIGIIHNVRDIGKVWYVATGISMSELTIEHMQHAYLEQFS